MTINAYKLNNAQLTIGTTPLDVSCQLTSVNLNPTENVETEEGVSVICGDQLPPSDTVSLSFTLSGTGLQDLEMGGFVEYTYTHASEEVPFMLQPDLATETTWTGVVRIVPLKIGGDAPTRPTSDFEWTVIGIPTPVFAPAALEDVA